MNPPLKYPVYQPLLGGNEKKYVLECMDSTWISSKGKFIAEFENSFASFIGCRHGVAVCNGTVAIHLALVALGIGPHDEVIVPTFTYIASANPVVQLGGTPVFVDSLPDTWQMDPAAVRARITPRTKAIIAVHLYGHPCDMEALSEIAKAHNLYLIEDCAEAIGSAFDGRNVGTFSDAACFSFFGNKTITCGEGGMVLTNQEAFAQKLVHYKGQGLAQGREYWHDVIGFNYRMTNIQAAIGLAQLEQVESFLARKQQIAALYEEALRGLPLQTHRAVGAVRHSHWMCSILLDQAAKRDALRAHLRARGIETRPAFFPLHVMPMYQRPGEAFPVADSLSARGINLPSYPGLSDEDVAFICRQIRSYYE